MMKLQHINSNCVVVKFADREVLFSYETPVAVVLHEAMHGFPIGLYRTGTKFSRTTSRHINSWFGKFAGTSIPHNMLENIANGR